MKRIPLEERLLAKVDQSGECWIWTGVISNGYGLIWLDGRMEKAHRASYGLFVGPIPPSTELDHLCHTRDLGCPGGFTCPHRRCVRPDHLEPVDHRTNMLRGRGPVGVNAAKTHCPEGHPYDPGNTRVRPDGARACRACKAASKKAKAKRPRSGSLPKRCLRALGSMGGSATTTEVSQWLRVNGEQADPYRVSTSLTRLTVQQPPLAARTHQGIPGGEPSTWELTAAGEALLARLLSTEIDQSSSARGTLT